jgi:hypothetical protein
MLADQLVQEVLETIKRTDIEERVWKLLNRLYLQVCEESPIEVLKRTLSLDLSTQPTTGNLLPLNLLGIVDPIRDANGVPFWRVGSQEIGGEVRGYRYVISNSGVLDHFRATDVSVDQGASSFISDQTSDDYTGEWVRFGAEYGFFKLTAAKQFTPAYRGPNLSDQVMVVRPVEQKRILFYDSSDDIISDGTIMVTYWETPPPVYKDGSDAILLPTAGVTYLQLLLYRNLPEAKDRRPVNGDELTTAGAAARRLTAESTPVIDIPRDRMNSPFAFTKNMYGSR